MHAALQLQMVGELSKHTHTHTVASYAALTSKCIKTIFARINA